MSASANTEQNRYAVSAAMAGTATVRHFGISLRLALLIPLLVIELVAMSIAGTKLIRHRELRSKTNLALTLIPALLLLGRIAIKRRWPIT
jgi:hypothetical protein